jgi:hypothetical protein
MFPKMWSKLPWRNIEVRTVTGSWFAGINPKRCARLPTEDGEQVARKMTELAKINP